LELGFEVPNLPGVPTVKHETIGQKKRLIKGAILQGLVNLVALSGVKYFDRQRQFKMSA
jgi:hypothetical protein